MRYLRGAFQIIMLFINFGVSGVGKYLIIAVHISLTSDVYSKPFSKH